MRFGKMLLQRLLGYFRRRGGADLRISVPNTLSGYFELRMDRIVGWARDAYGSQVKSMQIDILRHNSVVDSFAASPHREFGRFEFSHRIEGRFSGVDLVKEEVILIARDSDGNNGRLLLDGAAQIELIREYLGVPSVTVLDLDLTGEGNARPYLGVGWAPADPDFTFTLDDDSFITFETPREPGTYALRMTAGAFVRKPDVPGQELIVFVNATQVAQIFYNEAHAQFQECKFSHEVFSSEHRVTMRFHHPDAARPRDFGINVDPRRLAFYFKRLTLLHLLQVD